MVRFPVSRSALGRGLGNLMKESTVAPLPPSGTKPASLTPGVAALLKGLNGQPKAEPTQPHIPAPPKLLVGKRVLQFSLLLADVLLLALVAGIIFMPGHRLGFIQI